jgi:hypothetical protein
LNFSPLFFAHLFGWQLNLLLLAVGEEISACIVSPWRDVSLLGPQATSLPSNFNSDGLKKCCAVIVYPAFLHLKLPVTFFQVCFYFYYFIIFL